MFITSFFIRYTVNVVYFFQFFAAVGGFRQRWLVQFKSSKGGVGVRGQLGVFRIFFGVLAVVCLVLVGRVDVFSVVVRVGTQGLVVVVGVFFLLSLFFYYSQFDGFGVWVGQQGWFFGDGVYTGLGVFISRFFVDRFFREVVFIAVIGNQGEAAFVLRGWLYFRGFVVVRVGISQ